MTTQTELMLATTAVLHNAQQLATLNNDGIGLVSLDDLFATDVGIHPLVFTQQNLLSDASQQA